MGKFIQYELWKDCCTHCKFCYNKGEPLTDKQFKLERLAYIKGKLLSEECDLFDEIGFIGGEFFEKQLEDPDIRNGFYELFDICTDKYQRGKLNKLCVCTSLIFDLNKYFLPFVNYLYAKHLTDITLICTSYDTKYRFHTQDKEDLWKDNVILLHDKYDQLKIHTETLLTQDFINKVLSGEFKIQEFCKTYHTTIDYIEPSTGFYYADKYQMAKVLPDFYPTKESFFEFMYYTVCDERSISIQDLLNPFLRANVLYYTNNNEYMVIRGRQRNPDRRILKKVTVEDLDYGKEVRTVPQVLKDFDRGFIDSNMSMLDAVYQFRDTVLGGQDVY